ncbi:interleukin 17a/f1 [Cyprinodon tularosa]|uniref:interleukin 17a/f1 n=1 Tax=Cyprinodon tularosa TaxID=77115 RepID=UPI0018E1EBC0|nr:interleukin 17a/f1 [Cyprinodon tularosa]
MFPTSRSINMTAVSCVVVVVMMMVRSTEAASVHHSKHSNGFPDQTIPLHLDPKALVPSRNIRPLENISISPWTYNMSRDESLFPPTISEAQCLLHGCLDLEGKEDLNLRSRPIMFQALVLRRVKSAGTEQNYHYRLETRLIPFGCTCVRHVVHIQE